MTSKEVVSEILKMITAMNRTELTFMTKDGVPVAQFKKEDVEHIEKDLDKLSQLEDLEEELGLSAYKILERIKEKREK